MQKVSRWGNSCGVRLPAAVMKSAGLKPGDFVTIRLMDSGDLRVRPVVNVQPAEPLLVRRSESKW